MHGDHLYLLGRYTLEGSGRVLARWLQARLESRGRKAAQAAGAGCQRRQVCTMQASESCFPRLQLTCGSAGRGQAQAPALVADAKLPWCKDLKLGFHCEKFSVSSGRPAPPGPKGP